MRRLRKLCQILLPWFLAVLAVWTGNWSASALDCWLHGRFDDWHLHAGQVLAFVFVVGLLFHYRNQFWKPRTRVSDDSSPEPRPHLVLFLSPLNTHAAHDPAGWPEGFDYSGSLKDVLERFAESKRMAAQQDDTGPPIRPVVWNWEMPLRAIVYHHQADRSNDATGQSTGSIPRRRAMLKSISVVCSERSAEDFPRFRDIVRRYSQFRDVNLQILARQGSRVVLLPADECDTADCVWDFEAFDDLHCAVQGVIHALRRQGASDREIMIDFTGGQKVTSIVAATATYDLAVKAQYVQTNDPWSVRSYDVVIDRTDAGGLN